MNSSLIKGYLLLLLTAIIWGIAFIYQKKVVGLIDAFSFNALRFSLGTFALLPLFLLPKKIFQQNSNEKEYSSYYAGFFAGIFMFLGISLQQYGMEFTTAGKSGFLTALYIIFVPILAYFVIKQKSGLGVWLGGILSVIGISVIGITETKEALKLNFGDFLMFISAWCWAAQVLWLSIIAKYCNVLKVVIFQMLTVAILSIISAIIYLYFSDKYMPNLNLLLDIKSEIFYTGVISTSFAFTFQIFGQRSVPASNAAILMSLEGVFAVVAGILILNEVMSLSFLVGCGFIFCGIIIAQLRN